MKKIDNNLQVFQQNYDIYIKRQGDLINAAFEAIALNNDKHDVENAIKHLEQMFGRSTTARKIFWTASHHFFMYIHGQFFNLHRIPPDKFENRYSYKYMVAKNNYESNKEIFEERDKLVLSKLQEIWSKFVLPYSDLITKKEYFPNMIKEYIKSLKTEMSN